MEPDDDFDPWADTTPGVGEVHDDPFDDWPTASAMGEVTGPQSYEGLVTRAARGGALPHRRIFAWAAGVSMLVFVISTIVVGLALTR